MTDIFLEEGNLGYYDSCEILQIFVVNNGEYFNYYTRFTFIENNTSQKGEVVFLTDELKKINKDVKLGICKKVVSLSEGKKKIDILSNCVSTENETVDLGLNGEINVGKIEINKPQFLSRRNTINSPLEKILNIDYDCSYLVEFYSENKENLNALGIYSEEIIHSANELIKEFTDIDLTDLDDRIGNLIFQFPISVVSVTSKYDIESKIRRYKLKVNNRLNLEKDDLQFITFSFDQEVFNDFRMKSVLSDKIEITDLNEEYGKIDAVLYNRRENLILYSSKASIIKRIETQVSVVANQLTTPKKINNKKHRPTTITVGEGENGFARMTKNNRDKKKMRELDSSYMFKQYNKDINGAHEGALFDLRKIISTSECIEIYLWDPYLSSKDIVDTIFHCQYNDVILKAISSSKVKGVDNDSNLDRWFEVEHRFFDNYDTSELNLEFRCQRGEFGYKFHDRFLMLIFEDETKNKVLSLGASINHIGAEHTIVQAVLNSKKIIGSFLELWDKLDNSDCLVWKNI